MPPLLDRLYQVTHLVQSCGARLLPTEEIAEEAGAIVGASVAVVSTDGEILAGSVPGRGDSPGLPSACVSPAFRDWLSSFSRFSALEGVTTGIPEWDQVLAGKAVAVSVMVASGERLGTLVFIRDEGAFSEEDVALLELVTALVGHHRLRSLRAQEADEGRAQRSVELALGSLSYSEFAAVSEIVGELQGKDGLIVASRVADRAGITRSIIVNALKKCECAGVLEARSLGMKGTFVRFTNDRLTGELARRQR